MLVLSRRKDESVIINGNIRIVVVDARGDKVRLGIEAPEDVAVYRSELFEKLRSGQDECGAREQTSSDAEITRSILTPRGSRAQTQTREVASASVTKERRELKMSRDGVAYDSRQNSRATNSSEKKRVEKPRFARRLKEPRA